MIVIDASVAVLALLNDGDARAALGREAIASPHLVDSEVVSSLRAQVHRGELDAAAARERLDVWSQLGVERFGIRGLLDRMWELRDNLSAYDASYVALAESLEVALVTADSRLARASGPRCTITVVPR